jgi:hypothetical protein
MRCRFREISQRALCILSIFGLLALMAPGCGDAAKQGEAAKEIPTNVKESNNKMENFMKTQKSAKKN